MIIDDFIVKRGGGSTNTYLRGVIRHDGADYPVELDLYLPEEPNNPSAVAAEISKPLNRFWNVTRH
jgi:hypothetical protein